MIRKGVALFDVHLTQGALPRPYVAAKKFVSNHLGKKKWDLIVIGGDFMNMDSLSHWDRDKRRKMENKRFFQETMRARKELDDLRYHTKDMVYLEGNHENWVEQYIDRNPEMEGMIELPKQLELEAKKVDWIPMNELYKVGHLYFTHGMWTNKYFAAKHIQELGCNIVIGHKHQEQTFSSSAKMQKPIKAWGIGCLCDSAPHYMKGKPTNWSDGFAVFYWDDKTGDFNMYPVTMVKNKFLFEGKRYG